MGSGNVFTDSSCIEPSNATLADHLWLASEFPLTNKETTADAASLTIAIAPDIMTAMGYGSGRGIVTFPQFRGNLVTRLPPRFVLGRGVLGEGRVSAMPIIEHIDVCKDILPCLFSGHIAPMVHQLTFKGPEGAFDAGIVPAIPFATPAGNKTILVEDMLLYTVFWYVKND